MLFIFAAASTLTRALAAFFHDTRLQVALVLVAADVVLGVLAAWKHGTFRLAYLADFARNDLAFKLAPWLALYIGAKLVGGTYLIAAEIAAYAAIVAAWSGSIANSLAELGLPSGAKQSARLAIAGDERQPVAPGLGQPATL